MASVIEDVAHGADPHDEGNHTEDDGKSVMLPER